jgi:hypothetical protein
MPWPKDKSVARVIRSVDANRKPGALVCRLPGGCIWVIGWMCPLIARATPAVCARIQATETCTNVALTLISGRIHVVTGASIGAAARTQGRLQGAAQVLRCRARRAIPRLVRVRIRGACAAEPIAILRARSVTITRVRVARINFRFAVIAFPAIRATAAVRVVRCTHPHRLALAVVLAERFVVFALSDTLIDVHACQ